MRKFLSLFAAALYPRFLMAPDTGATGGGATKRDSGLGPQAIEPDPDREVQLRRQARATARTLSQKADERARELSAATGRTVLPEVTATEDELYEALMAGDTTAHDTPLHLTSGPNPGVAGLRVGESRTGPATGKLLIGGLVPEHQSMAGGTLPTLNAPGTGADTGLKLTPDNPDARAGDGGHAEGVDPADTGTRGDARTAPERHDTAEERAAREAAGLELNNLLARGEVPTREQFRAAGCPEDELDEAIEDAKAEIEQRKASSQRVQENRDVAASTAPGATASSENPASAQNNTATPPPASEK